MTQIELLQNIFIGIILTATSVSITVETLREMGKLKTSTGTAILGDAVIDDVIDDVIAIITFTIILGFADPFVGIMSILIRIFMFLVFAIIVAIVFKFVFKHLSNKHGQKRRVPIYGLVFCLLLSYAAEKFFGITDITGAYLAGIIISNAKQADYISGKFEVLSYMILSPVFFASIGIKTHITSISRSLLIFTAVLLVVAILSKVIGCGLGAKLTGFKNKDSLKIGFGMISRGEVALILAGKGAVAGLMSEEIFVPIVIVVIVTTILSPLLLKVAYNESPGKIVQKCNLNVFIY